MVFLGKFSFLTFLYCSMPLVYSPACRTQYPHRLQCQSHFDHCFSLNSPGHRKWAKLHGNPLYGEQPQDNKDESQTGEGKKEEKQTRSCAPRAAPNASENTAGICGDRSHWGLEQVIGEEVEVRVMGLPRLWSNLSACSFSLKFIQQGAHSSILLICAALEPRQLPRRLHSLSHHVRLPLSLEVVGGAGRSHPGGLHADAHPAALGAAAEVDSVPNAKLLCPEC